MQSWVKNLYIERSGPETAPPVLVLHGWGSNAGLMRPLVTALQDTYHVFNVDMPGHGQTPVPPTAWGIPEHAELVQALINEEIGQPVHVVGHSNGGRISLYMASRPKTAGLIRTLSLISPSGVTPKRSAKYYVKRGIASTLKAPLNLLPGSLKAYGNDWLRHTLIWRMLGSSDYSQLQGVMREVFVKTVNCHIDEDLSEITAPTLLFWGTEDTAISRYQMDYMIAHIPGSELVTLDGATHYGYLDQPQIVTAGIRHFLSLHAHVSPQSNTGG